MQKKQKMQDRDYLNKRGSEIDIDRDKNFIE